MTTPEQPQTSRPVAAASVDDAHDFDLGLVDVVLGLLTMPLLFWVLMYAVTGAEHILATRRARIRLYMILLAIELAMVAAIVLVIVR
jgi:hypothetical protein